MIKIDNFNGKIIKNVIQSYKFSYNTKMRTVTIADLHGYTNNSKRATRLAETIKKQAPNFIFIAGDIFHGGTPWEGGRKLKLFRNFIDNISEVAPVFITWGNHDLRKMTPDNKNIRIDNLNKLENVRPGQIYPLYNDRVVVNGMEIIGYVPSFDIIEGSMKDHFLGVPIQLHGIAHDKFIQEYEEKGVKFEHPELVTTYLGHDPHLIAVSENGIGLGSLSSCDYFIAGHLHDGYKLILNALGLGKLESLKYDQGWTAQPSVVDKNGKIIKRNFILGKTNLCRGIVYFDDRAQQKIWQSPDSKFYKNIAIGDNNQIWSPILEEIARAEILNNKLHFMLISEGIAPGFASNEKLATINVVDFEGVKKR